MWALYGPARAVINEVSSLEIMSDEETRAIQKIGGRARRLKR